MVVQLGTKGQPDSTQPIAWLMDCHRRIEHFLEVLINVTRTYEHRELDDEGRRALTVALDYFRHAAPRHTADEEHSLFPRMRNSDDRKMRESLEALDRLEDDHRKVEAAHQRVDQLGRRWLDARTLDQPSHAELTGLLSELAASYAKHIELEDQRVFVLAEQMLDADAMQAIGREMRQRRSDAPPQPPSQPSDADHAMLVELDLSRFAESVATTPSVPASGCVAALVGALAAALTHMIVSLSRSDAANRDVPHDRSETLTQLKQQRTWLLACVDRDARAFREFQSARKDGEAMDGAAGSGIIDVPRDVASHCLATIECLAHGVNHTKPYLKAEAYAAATLALTAIDVSRFNLHENAQFLQHADAHRAYHMVGDMHDNAARLHEQIASTLAATPSSGCAASESRGDASADQKSSLKTMHDKVETWDDVCCCEPEPRWQAVAEDLARAERDRIAEM
jgi:formiminotetrahydrofolate cyclodeaminase/hemerythrin-like domain-containing protein